MVCHQDRLLNYKSARGLFPGHPWNRWPLLKPVTFFSRSLPSEVLMTIQRNNLRIPEGTQTYAETLHEIIFQYECIRKVLTILAVTYQHGIRINIH